MVLRVISKIQVQQVPNDTFPTRNKLYTFPGATSYEVESSWSNFTSIGKLTVPKNIWVKDQNGNKVNLGGDLGGQNNNIPIIAPIGSQHPIFMRGDKITIEMGYAYFDNEGNPQYVINPLPCNFITSVTTKMPMEIEFQDNMYLMKQVQAPNQVWPASQYALEDIMASLINTVNSVKGTNFTLAPNPTGTTTNIGDFRTQNETVAQVLERLQKTGKIESFFRGNVFHSGLIVYYPGEANQFTFEFQKNIINDELKYKRLDDVQIALHAYSVNKTELQTQTQSGRTKTKKTRLEITVTKQNGKYIVLNSKQNEKGGIDGQIRTMYFWNITDINVLQQKAQEALNRFFYEGYRGKFTIFGLPFVKHGDQVTIIDKRLPERNGTYFVKSVKYSGGIGGLRQEIEVDLRIDGVFTQAQIDSGV